VPLHAVCSLNRNRFRRTARFACFVLLILLVIHTESSAASSYPSGQETLLSETTSDSFPVIDGDYDNGVKPGEVLIRKTTFTPTVFSQFSTSASPSSETAAGESQAQSTVAEGRVPDWNGIWRDTGILFVSQLAAGAFFYAMPESVSDWSSEQRKSGFKQYGDNFVDPVFDKNSFTMNYVLHPYWGATYYIRGRERGLDKVSSFVYSALISAMYEFGVECFFEKPSIQDLIVTPVAGSLLGAFIFEPWRESIKRKQELRWYDHAALVLTDPVGVLSLGFEKLFGIKSTIMVDYSVPQLQKPPSGTALASRGNRIGASMQFTLD
jgi:hypothetical protein